MIKTVKISSNKKLGGIAATYRSGKENVYSTCPETCPLKPTFSRGTSELDENYYRALLRAVPEGGSSWTYTHFDRSLLEPIRGLSEEEDVPLTTVNISTDSVADALAVHNEGWPTVMVAPSTALDKVDSINGIRFVRCPAEYQEHITCNNCGGDKPLCARADRNYVIKFTAHGTSKKKVNLRVEGQSSETGGCYGSSGPVAIQWKRTMGDIENDAETLTQFVAGLPKGSKIRHHVVGDLGK